MSRLIVPFGYGVELGTMELQDACIKYLSEHPCHVSTPFSEEEKQCMFVLPLGGMYIPNIDEKFILNLPVPDSAKYRDVSDHIEMNVMLLKDIVNKEYGNYIKPDIVIVTHPVLYTRLLLICDLILGKEGYNLTYHLSELSLMDDSIENQHIASFIDRYRVKRIS